MNMDPWTSRRHVSVGGAAGVTSLSIQAPGSSDVTLPDSDDAKTVFGRPHWDGWTLPGQLRDRERLADPAVVEMKGLTRQCAQS